MVDHESINSKLFQLVTSHTHHLRVDMWRIFSTIYIATTSNRQNQDTDIMGTCKEGVKLDLTGFRDFSGDFVCSK